MSPAKMKTSPTYGRSVLGTCISEEKKDTEKERKLLKDNWSHIMKK